MAHRRQGALGPGKPFSTVFILLDDHHRRLRRRPRVDVSLDVTVPCDRTSCSSSEKSGSPYRMREVRGDPHDGHDSGRPFAAQRSSSFCLLMADSLPWLSILPMRPAAPR